MGIFDSVKVPCPNCGKIEEFQSKSGHCFGEVFNLSEAPSSVLADINRHSPYECRGCGVEFRVKIQTIATSVRD